MDQKEEEADGRIFFMSNFNILDFYQKLYKIQSTKIDVIRKVIKIQKFDPNIHNFLIKSILH